MSLRKFVKLSQVSNLSDARYGAGMGVDLIGFPIDPTMDDHITPAQFKEICSWISGPGLVGEIHHSPPDLMHELVDQYPIDYIEISRQADLDSYATFGKPLIIKLDLEHYTSLDDLEAALVFCAGRTDLIILENHGKTNIQLEDLLPLSKNYDLLIGFDITPENLLNLIMPSAIKGISLKGGHEIKVGFKDYEEIATILEILEEE